ncbi:MAG: hypothetical protein KDE62_09955, partial [Calditrichaeota bacterium]|nr:hypothetical protein [Calditrichota bacterium]
MLDAGCYWLLVVGCCQEPTTKNQKQKYGVITMHTLRKFFSLIIMLLYVCPFFAQENNWRLPDSPTGTAAAALLDAIDAGDAVAAEAFINSYFAP